MATRFSSNIRVSALTLRLPWQCLLVLLLELVAAFAFADPLKLPLSTQGARIVDASGSEVVLHGANVSGMEWGAGTAWGASCNDPQWGNRFGCYGMPSATMYDNIANWGFNLVRIPVSWSNIEPVNGGPYNEAYLRNLDSIVDQFGKRNIVVIFSMHQWAWSPAIDAVNPYSGATVHGNGWPVWLYPNSWFSVNPVTGLPRPKVLTNGLDGQTAAASEFFANKRMIGNQKIQDKFIAVWSMLAQRYRSTANVVGADMMNEPYDNAPGQAGQPGQLEDLYARTAAAIHQQSPDWLLVFQNSLSVGSINGASILAAPGFPANKGVYSFHLYAATWDQIDPGLNPQGNPKLVARNQLQKEINVASQWQVPLWLGEFHLIMQDHLVNAEQSGPMLNFMWKDGVGGNGAMNVNWTYWAYQKDSQSLNGADDKGPVNTDLVHALQGGLHAANPVVYNIPAPSNADQPFLRFYNTSSGSGQVRGTLYDQSGNVLGKPNSVLIASLASNAVTALAAADIASAFGVPSWTGRAWMSVQADFPGLQVLDLIRSSLLLNTSCLNDQYALYLPNPGSTEQPYLRLYNTSGAAGAVRGTLHDEAGNVLGSPDTVLVASLAPNAVLTLGSADLAQAFNTPSWSGNAWMRFSADFPGLKIMNNLRDLTTNTLVDVSCDTGLSGVGANVYNLPPPNSTTSAVVRIHNTSAGANTLTGTLYAEDGSVLGQPNAALGSVPANGVMTRSQNDIAALVGAGNWSGRAWMQINSSGTGLAVLTFTRQALNMEMNCVEENGLVLNIPDAGNPQDQALIRIYNTSSTAGAVYGSLYDQSGAVLGVANALLMASMPAKSVGTFSAATLASAVGAPSWTGRAWMRLSSSISGLKAMNILQDVASGTWSNMSCATN